MAWKEIKPKPKCGSFCVCCHNQEAPLMETSGLCFRCYYHFDLGREPDKIIMEKICTF